MSGMPTATGGKQSSGTVLSGLTTALASAAVRTTPWSLMLLAAAVGAGTGAGSVVFRWCVATFTRFFSGHADYTTSPGASNPHAPWLGPYFVLFAPVVGGLLYGPLVNRFAKEARGHGVPEVMLAVAQQGGRISPRVTTVKTLASALTIGSGGSVGRTGPIVQIGSALGSTVGRVTKAPERRMKLLVACGAAGGIAATFNAPLAGVFFAMELILGTFSAEAFGATGLSSVIASIIGRAVFGDSAFLNLPDFHADRLTHYGLFALLGTGAAVVGVGFSRFLYLIEDACDWLWRGPEWLRPAVGGLLLGPMLLALPEMYGVGYPVLQKATEGEYTTGFLILLLVGKMLATSLTLGAGGSGGVFAPSLFIGSMLGSAYGIGVHHLLPGSAGAVGAYALVGMGAVFAGASRAPITAVVLLFELTGEYSIIGPLMLAIVLATAVSRLLTRDTVYTLKLRRRGIDLAMSAPGAPIGSQHVGVVMESLPAPLTASSTLVEASDLLTMSGHGALPVIDDAGEYVGIVTAQAVAEAIAEQVGVTPTSIGQLAEPTTTVTTDQSLAQAIPVLLSGAGTGVPVLDSEYGRPIGWLSHQSALRAVQDPAA